MNAIVWHYPTCVGANRQRASASAAEGLALAQSVTTPLSSAFDVAGLCDED
jgi:hypothetical protein